MSRTSGIFSDSSGRNSEIYHCRLCITRHDYYYNIFTSIVECKITVKDALHDLVGLQVVVGDGLPTTVCPLCLKKLTEFSVFKKICLESNAVLRRSLPKNYCSSAEGDRAADDKSGPSVETKDGIRDVIENTSEFACSAQMTEVYIPVPDCLLPRDDKSFSVKKENEDQLSEETLPALYTSYPAGISSDASDPLGTDDLPHTSTASRGEEVDADAGGAVLKDLDWKLIEAKKEPSAEESDAAKPTSTDSGEFIENWTMAHESTVEAAGLAAPNRLHVKTPSASYLQGERDVKIDGSYDFLAPSTSGTLIGSESGASHAEEGRNVIEYDLQKCGTDKLTSCLFPDDGQYYTKYIQASKISGDGSRMSFVGGRGNCDAEDTVDTLCCVESREERESGTEAFMREKEEISNCLVKNPGISCVANDSLYHCFNTIDGMGNESKFSKGLETHLGARNLDGDAESLNTSGPPTTSKTVKGLNMTRKCMRRKGKGPVEENSVGVGKRGNVEKDRKFGTADSETCAQNLSSKSYSGVGINRDEARGSSMERVYSCSVCAETFTQVRTLGDHVLTHTREKSYSCTVCERRFSQRYRLNNHMRTHTGEKPYACSICSDRFSLSNSLSKHMRRHTGERPYTCNVCGRSFTLGSNLDVHMRVHTREKPYSCDVCNKSFSTKNHLVIHCRTHSGERPYSCSICCRSFNQSSDLTKHKRSHTGEKPYSCNACGKSFSLKSTLNRHKRTHRTGT